MKSVVCCALCMTLACADFVRAQESSGKPAYVYVVSAGAVVVIGGLWAYRAFVKKPGAPSQKSIKQQALEELKYIGSEAEIKALQKLKAPEAIHDFMAKFWDARDPSPGTELNEVQEEFYQRRDYANAHFGKEGWKTDRGRAYILYGPPDDIERVPMANFHLPNRFAQSVKAMEAWIYLRPATASPPENIFSNYYPGAAKFVFADFTGSGDYTQIYSSERGEMSDPSVYIIGNWKRITRAIH